MPRNGILFFLAYFIDWIFPSVPLFPKPPGIKIPEISFNLDLTSEIFNFSESILIKFTLVLFSIPPWVSASSSDL